jgi:uncharacterized protein YdeI (YjbR/CyaY-like superfamily)
MSEFKINDLSELQSWLDLNCETAGSTWLIFPKKVAGASFAWPEIVDVLLCYGWIDSLPRKIDESYTSIRISPRNPKSKWSRVNKDKVAKLEELGLIQPNGIKVIETAKENGAWFALDELDNLNLPKDLREYLTTKNLLIRWDEKSISFKRGFLEMLLNLKKPESRLKKITSLNL